MSGFDTSKLLDAVYAEATLNADPVKKATAIESVNVVRSVVHEKIVNVTAHASDVNDRIDVTKQGALDRLEETLNEYETQLQAQATGQGKHSAGSSAPVLSPDRQALYEARRDSHNMTISVANELQQSLKFEKVTDLRNFRF